MVQIFQLNILEVDKLIGLGDRVVLLKNKEFALCEGGSVSVGDSIVIFRDHNGNLITHGKTLVKKNDLILTSKNSDDLLINKVPLKGYPGNYCGIYDCAEIDLKNIGDYYKICDPLYVDIGFSIRYNFRINVPTNYNEEIEPIIYLTGDPETNTKKHCESLYDILVYDQNCKTLMDQKYSGDPSYYYANHEIVSYKNWKDSNYVIFSISLSNLGPTDHKFVDSLYLTMLNMD